MPEIIKKRKVIIVTGKTGFGKSYLVHSIIKQYKRLIIIDPNAEYNGVVFYSFYDFAEYMKQLPNEFCCVCRFSTSLEEEYLFRAVWEIGECCLVMEEFGDFLSEMEKDDPLYKLIRRGRHKAISIIGISVRLPDFPPIVRSQCNTFITFRQDEPIDLDRMEKMGLNREKIQNLPYFKYELKGDTLN